MSKNSVTKNSSIRFGKLSVDDGLWLATQHDCVKTLWFEAITADPFGNTFKPFTTQLKNKSFQRARKVLTEKGLFEFEPKYSGKDRRIIECWTVKNLHGSNMPYWGSKSQPTNYAEFLQSEYWQSVRVQVLERDHHTCQQCGVTKHLHVHHLSYEHHGEEHLYLDDLVTLCSKCHAQAHNISE